jgi:hypothetical protein
LDRHHALVRRVRGGRQPLPEHANTARNELDEARSVALAALTMTTGQVKDLIARVNTMSTCPELDAARKFADDRTKEASKKDVAPFNRLLVNLKKMLTHCERERKLAGSAAEDTTAAAPLYAILKAIADDGDVNADGSLFDAQEGTKAALLAPKACLRRVEMGTFFVCFSTHALREYRSAPQGQNVSGTIIFMGS